MKNIVIGLLALPVIALILGGLYLLLQLVLFGVGAVVAVVVTFAPIVLGALASIAILVGVVYAIGAFVRGVVQGIKESR